MQTLGADASRLLRSTTRQRVLAARDRAGKEKERGRQFVCAELRNIGANAGCYSVDFEVVAAARSITAGIARQIEIPRSGNGKSAPEPHCRFEEKSFDVVE